MNKPTVQHENYLSQYFRMKRYHQRFESLTTGIYNPEHPSDYYIDDAYAFFQNCFHLKDWIKEDNNSGKLKDLVEKFINGDASLSLCRDICNGLKHFKLDPSKSFIQSGQTPTFSSRLYKRGVGSSSPTLSAHLNIETKGGTLDAFQLATDCVKSWEKFLTDNDPNFPSGS